MENIVNVNDFVKEIGLKFVKAFDYGFGYGFNK